ncbi:MAG: FAD/NAD(P)-binding protein, partial [Calditrichia bacterium]|nr:FAD/NAD(P)-binding protein [Calditrichia bacterium]
MALSIGSKSRPLTAAIIGSGPSGFYAADHLLKQEDLHVEVDMFDKLPTPYGLVRAGVAPDHQQIKSVSKIFEKLAQNS